MTTIIKIWIFAVLILTSFCIHSQIQIGNDIDGLLAGDRFGTGVSVSSDGSIVAIVGYSGNSGDDRIRVFRNIGDVWTLYGTDNNGENFGGLGAFSVSLSADGNTLAFGQLGEHVKVFSYNTNSEIWTQKGNDIINTTTVGNFGFSIKLSSDGNTIVIGAPDAPIVPESGVTQIFQYETDSWNQVGNNINGLVSAEHSGRSVDMSSNGQIVAVLNDNSVRVYENDSGTWNLLADEIPANGSQFPNKAVSLSSNGELLAIGEPDFSDSLIQRGRVRVFSFTGGVWIQIGSDILGEVAYYRTGACVSLSSNGQILAVGEIGSTSSSTDTGRTRLFKNQDDSWIQIGNSIFGEANEDYSGENLSLSSDASTLIIGASQNDGNGVDSGHARVFDIHPLLSIDELQQSEIKMFPNPAKDQLYIRLPIEIEINNITIFNDLGTLVKTIYNNTINISNLSTGIYFIVINTNEGKTIKKLIIH